MDAWNALLIYPLLISHNHFSLLFSHSPLLIICNLLFFMRDYLLLFIIDHLLLISHYALLIMQFFVHY